MYEYIIIILFFLWFIPFLYVKIAYPFWSHQPVFHYYDILRYWTQHPYIIYQNKPIKSKFLSKHVQSEEFLDLDEKQYDEIVDFIQSHYIDSEKVLMMITKEDMKKDFIGLSHPSYISFYYDKQYNYSTKSYNETLPKIEETKLLVGTITSRAIKIYLNAPVKHEQFVYYWDYLCVHRDFTQKYLGRNLIQSHVQHQRFHNKEIASGLFKQEINLCDCVVPLIKYNVYSFPLENTKKPPLKKYTIERIKNNNVHLFFDYLYHITHSGQSYFDLCIFPEIQVLDLLIENERLFVYGLKEKSKILGFYFFKNPKMCYETTIDRNVLDCVGSVFLEQKSQHNQSLFFAGLLHAIYDLQHVVSEKFKIISFYQIMDNQELIERWGWKYNPTIVTQSAYYLYNVIFPKMPYDGNKSFILL